MGTKRILIVGGGFAGLMAAWRLHGTGHDVTLLDPRSGSHFLPLLPDVVGRGLQSSHLCYPFLAAARRWGFTFVQTAATAIDLTHKSVETDLGCYAADGVILATGSQTAFHGRDDLAQHALTLDSLQDAARIGEVSCANPGGGWVVCGGGYTGAELATNLWRLYRKRLCAPARIVLVNRVDGLCTGLPQSFQTYIQKQIESLDIELRLATTVEAYEDGAVTLSTGETFPDVSLAWTAGVRPVDAITALSYPKGQGGRLQVDECLCLAPRVYAAGDTCAFSHQGSVLRLGIQFAISQGWHAAGNLLREFAGKMPKAFRPFDPGYVVPLAHGTGCGAPLGVPLYGRTPWVMHYCMSLLRTWGVRQRLRLLRDLLG